MKLRGKKLENGRFKFEGSDTWVKLRLQGLPVGDYTVEFKKGHKRSLQQNAYLHSVLIPCFREALNSVGYDEVRTDLQAKKIIKEMFLKTSVVNPNTGEMLEYTKDTSELTKEEMSILYEDVWKFAAEHLDYRIPSPNEQMEFFQSQ
jgi:hypothetical protein